MAAKYPLGDVLRAVIAGKVHHRTAARLTGLTVDNISHLVMMLFRSGEVK